MEALFVKLTLAKIYAKLVNCTNTQVIDGAGCVYAIENNAAL